MTKTKPKAKKPSPPPRRTSMHGYQDDEATSTPEKQADIAHDAPHKTLPGRDVPKEGQMSAHDQEQLDNPQPKVVDEDLPLAPVGMKPNDLISLPPGSVNAPPSIPGAPPTDEVVPEPEEPPAE
jgi:hypothetical protein